MDTLSQRKNLIEKEQQRIVLAKRRFIWAGLLSFLGSGWYEYATSRWLHWLPVCAHNARGFLVGRDIFAKAWRLAKQRTAKYGYLNRTGSGFAYGYSLPSLSDVEGISTLKLVAAIITFVLLGRFLEERAKVSGEAIRKLVDLQAANGDTHP